METFAKQKQLLVITQVVDNTHSVLGFFCDWLQEFETNTEQLTIIGQQVGTHDVMSNAVVASLGKETGNSTLKQIIRFWKLIWKNRKEYDVVFVHMTPIWVILGWPVWFVLRKRVYLWYESRGVTWQLKLAVKLVHKHFSASAYGMPIASNKHIVAGHGIDTLAYTYALQAPRDPLILCVGRISPAKRPLDILEVFKSLPTNYRLVFAGGTLTTEEAMLQQELQATITRDQLNQRVRIATFKKAELIALYQQADVMIHMSTTPLDKAILEAMACGCIVVSTGAGAKQVLPPICQASNETIAKKVHDILNLGEAESQALRLNLRQVVVQQHGLSSLIQRLVEHML